MILRLCMLAALLSLAGSSALAQGAAVQEDAQSRPGADVRAERLRAWQQLDAPAQAKLRQRFEALKKLSAAERARLTQRAARLQKEMAATLDSLNPAERAAVEAMEPTERARVLRDLVRDRARRAAARLRERMTPLERERFSAAGAEERGKILRAVRQRERKKLPEHLAKLVRAMDLSPGEVRKIQGGSRAEKREAIAAFVRRRAQAYVDEHGLPSSIEPEEWVRALSKDDHAFLRTIMRVRARHPEFGIPSERWEKRVLQRRSLQGRLVALSTPTARDRVRRHKAGGATADRRAILRNRTRAEELLARHGGLTPATAAKLRKLDDDGFVRVYRYLLRQLEASGEPGSAVDRWFERESDSPR